MPKFKHSPNGTGTVTKLSGNRRRPFWAQAPHASTWSAADMFATPSAISRLSVKRGMRSLCSAGARPP